MHGEQRTAGGNVERGSELQKVFTFGIAAADK
jgi:hypothetical protein